MIIKTSTYPTKFSNSRNTIEKLLNKKEVNEAEIKELYEFFYNLTAINLELQDAMNENIVTAIQVLYNSNYATNKS